MRSPLAPLRVEPILDRRRPLSRERADYRDLFRRAADFVDKILKRAKSGRCL